jgi:hypothetical protein
VERIHPRARLHPEQRQQDHAGRDPDRTGIGDVHQWGALMDGSLPVAIFYSLFVDYYVSSLTGAEKE